MNYFHPETFIIALAMIIILGGVILSALALQEAIDYSLRYGLSYKGDGDILAARWVYAIVAMALTFLLFWFSWSQMHTSTKSKSG